ncbi:MAG: L,D-transpeptidase family protein [Pseudomonadota bacterium]
MLFCRAFSSAVAVAIVLASPARAVEPDAPERLIDAEEAVVIAVKRSLETGAAKLADEDKADRAVLATFYAEHGNAPLWIAKSGLSLRAAAVVAEIRRADDWGLVARDFALPDLAMASDGAAELPQDVLIDAERKISLAVLKYARHARGGRIADPTSQLSSYLDRKPQLVEPRTVLAEIAKAGEPDAYLRGLHPKHAQFEKLRQKLVEMRGGAAKDEALVEVPVSGPKLAPGKSHPDIALIRKRLGVAPAEVDGKTGPEELYDSTLVAAVKEFQRGKGLTPDGNIGRSTRTAFGEGPRRADDKQILANMEAWRWMPADLGDIYVWVNIPEFTLRVVKNGAVVHSERVITGKPETQTPIFSDEMETVVFHPMWGVPESIKVKELLPSLARGSDLSRHGLRLQKNGRDVDPTSVDWSTADIRNFHIYQPPGGGNVLGVVKFLFPNKHQVYMHDTPTKNLFSASQRTFSHGCMRVRNPVRLAEIVLGEDKGWSSEQVGKLVKGGPQNNNVDLARKIPVHVTYFTAWVDDDGKLQSSRDIYGHEKRIQLALDGKEHLIARHRDHLAPVPYQRPTVVVQKQGPSFNFFSALFGGF